MRAGRTPSRPSSPYGHGDGDRVRHGLPQGRRQVVALAGVVRDVDRPHPARLVAEPVVPVVDEVPAQDRRGPGEPALAEVERAEAEGAAGAGPRCPQGRDGESGAGHGGRGEAAVHALESRASGHALRARDGGRLAQVGQLLLHLADLVRNRLRVGQPSVPDPSTRHVADRGQDRGHRAGGQQRAPVPATARRDRVEQPLGEVRRDQGSGAHREARERVSRLVVTRPGPRLDGVRLLPGDLGADRRGVRRDGEHRQVDLHG